MCNGKVGMRLLGTHSWFCSSVNEFWKSHLLFIHSLHDQCSKLSCADVSPQKLMFQNREKLEGLLVQLWLSPLPPPEPRVTTINLVKHSHHT